MDNRVARLITVMAIISILCIIVYYYLYILLPFIIASIITLYIQPIVSFIETRLKIKRIWSTFIVLSSSLLIFTLLCYMIGKLLLTEASEMVQNASTYLQSFKQVNIIFEAKLQSFTNWFMRIFPFLPIVTDISIQSYGDELMETLIGSIMTVLQSSVRAFSTLIYSFSQVVMVLIIILIATFIMIYDFHALKERSLSYLPDILISKLMQLYKQLKKSFLAFIKAQVIIAFYTACIVWIGLFIFQVEHALLIGLFVFIIDFFPYLGIGVLFLPWIFYHFFIGNYVITIQLAIIYMIIIIFRQIMEPKIVATTIGLHPLVTVFVLFFGITQFGVLGILLTPLLLIIISAIYHAQIIPAIYTYVKDGK